MDNHAGMGAPEQPWYLRTSARTAGTIAGLVAVLMGIWAAVSISPLCIVAGVLEILNGLILLSMEAPYLVGFLSFLTRVANFWENKPVYFKIAFYAIIGILPLLLCFGISTILASAGILITAVLYGFMAVGKRGSAAGGQLPPPMTGDVGGYGQMDRSGLVEDGMYGGQSNKGGAY
ncbi:putative Calcium channel flower [Hypsibius exemplaris]|uniref:Calcium channel flower n=1 Tax=Hypsibius exemplaris TaxID=2072580 RepID=A0A9X6NGR4_HYPEX|nr:putative Calcium channel flower [Hypsibius exemplaris]